MVSIEIHIPSLSRGGHHIHPVHHYTFMVAVTELGTEVVRLEGSMLGVLTHGDSIAIDPLTVVYLMRLPVVDLWRVARVVSLAKEHFAQDRIRVVCHAAVEEM